MLARVRTANWVAWWEPEKHLPFEDKRGSERSSKVSQTLKDQNQGRLSMPSYIKGVPVAVWSPLWRPGAGGAACSSLVTRNGPIAGNMATGPHSATAPQKKDGNSASAMGPARPAETSEVGMLSSCPWGRARAHPGSLQVARVSSAYSPPFHKVAKLVPGLPCTFGADNLRAMRPKPELGHVLYQRILSMAECIYLKVLIKE